MTDTEKAERQRKEGDLKNAKRADGLANMRNSFGARFIQFAAIDCCAPIDKY